MSELEALERLLTSRDLHNDERMIIQARYDRLKNERTVKQSNSDHQLEHLTSLYGLKRRWWGLEPDFMLRERVIHILEKTLYSDRRPT